MGKYEDQMKRETIQPFGWSLGGICDKLEADITDRLTKITALEAKLSSLESKITILDQTVAKCCGGGTLTLTDEKTTDAKKAAPSAKAKKEPG